jgi:hypothetical protein
MIQAKYFSSISGCATKRMHGGYENPRLNYLVFCSIMNGSGRVSAWPISLESRIHQIRMFSEGMEASTFLPKGMDYHDRIVRLETKVQVAW